MPRFRYALLGALALHGLVALLRTRHGLEAPSLFAKVEPAAQSVELEEFPVEAEPVEQTSLSASASTRAEPRSLTAPANRAAGPLSKSTSPELEASPELATAGDALAAPVAAGDADALPARKIDLGLDDHFLLHYAGPANSAGPAPEAELGPRARKSTAERQLQSALLQADVQHGLARGNALLGSLNSAARSEGPLRGEAIFRATVTADGSFGNVELLQGTATEWSAVLNAFRQLAARKHVRVPPGAKGLRVTFSVKAKVQRPSGKETENTPVRVGTPAPTPIGLGVDGDFDLADLGGGAQRLVYARVVSEEVL